MPCFLEDTGHNIYWCGFCFILMMMFFFAGFYLVKGASL